MTLIILYNLALFWISFLGPYNNRRNNRNCATMKNRLNFDTTYEDLCSCEGFIDFVYYECIFDTSNSKEFCFGSSEEPQYCMQQKYYTINSNARSRSRLSPVTINNEQAVFGNDNFTLEFLFFLADDTAAPIVYESCDASFRTDTYKDCTCNICDNGSGVTYDCSSIGGPSRNATCTSIRSLTPTEAS